MSQTNILRKLEMTEAINVEGTDVVVIDGWVSLKALCKALNIQFPRQREKAKEKYNTQLIHMPTNYQGHYYAQVCVTRKDAEDFIESGGIWKKGPYEKSF